jgi:hypothetical protein
MDWSKLDFYKMMLYKSIKTAKQHHKVILYTDSESLPHFEHISVEKRIVDTNGFLFMDDLKIHLLSMISEDEILIDTDLFLHKQLELPNGYDLYLDYQDPTTEWHYNVPYDYFVSKGIREAFPLQFDEIIPNSGNIGILYFTNKEFRKKYIDLYWRVREWVLGLDEWYEHTAVFLGQYLLGVVLHSSNYKVCPLKETHNDYTHYASYLKFESDVIDKIPIIYPPVKII